MNHLVNAALFLFLVSCVGLLWYVAINMARDERQYRKTDAERKKESDEFRARMCVISEHLAKNEAETLRAIREKTDN